MIDTSIVPVHQHGAYISRNRRQSMGRSRGDLTSKIHAVVDTNGLPVRLALTPGEARDNRLCSVLLSALLQPLSLSRTQPDRTVLQQDQATSACRDPIRQARGQLSGLTQTR